MLGYHLVLVALDCGLHLVLSKTISIGDIKYHIYCISYLLLLLLIVYGT